MILSEAFRFTHFKHVAYQLSCKKFAFNKLTTCKFIINRLFACLFAPFKAHQSYMHAGCESAWALGGELCHLPAPGTAQTQQLITQGSHDLNLIVSTLPSMALVNQRSAANGCNHTTYARRLQRHPFHSCPRWNNKIIIQRWKGSSVSWSLAGPVTPDTSNTSPRRHSPPPNSCGRSGC